MLVTAMFIDFFRKKTINYKAELIAASILETYTSDTDPRTDKDDDNAGTIANRLDRALTAGVALTIDTHAELKLGIFGRARLFRSIQILLLESGIKRDTAAAIVEKLVMALVRNKSLLNRKPDYAIAYFNLGQFYRRQGRHNDAIAAYERAIENNPVHVEAYNNLGVVLMETGLMSNAIEQFNKALGIEPEYIKALNNLGHACLRLEKQAEAFTYFNRALEINPAYYMAHYNLGNLLLKQKRYNEALDRYRQVIEINPGFADVYYSMGCLYNLLGRKVESIESLEKALAIRPDYPEALVDLGNSLLQLNRNDQAYNCLMRADTLRKNYFPAKFNLGNLMLKLKRHEEAINFFETALAIKPDSPEIYNNLGNAYKGLTRYQDALGAYEKALLANPQDPDVLNNIGNIFLNTGRIDAAVSYYKKAIQINSDSAIAQSNLLLCLNCLYGIQEAEIYIAHKTWGLRFEQSKSSQIRPHQNSRDVNRRLRVGYLSPDFRMHSVAFFIESVFSAHLRDEFQIYAYDNAVFQDDKSRRLMEQVDTWRKIAGMDDDQVVKLVRDDKIDILVDLAGHTENNRMGVFAMTAAPVQVSYLGYPNTTGLSAVNYRITDEICDPTGASESFYTEKLVRLPSCFLCYRPQPDSPDTGALPALSGKSITFGSFNNYSKINQEMIKTWSAILRDLPRARLVLKFIQYKNAEICQAIKNKFAELGIAPERLELIAWVPSYTAHLAQYNRIDIALDTFPYNGTTTTCEALWMGVPVITVAGQGHRSRVGKSLLTTLGLEQLVAESVDDYVAKAVALAGNLASLAELRATLRDRMLLSPLTDALKFTRSLETAYRMMWENWCHGRT
jgi:predicted O-linked N-acetylglucosamine transferase (SPINDLY family)